MVGITRRYTKEKVNHLKPSGNYVIHLFQQSITLNFVFMCFVWFSLLTAIISLNNINQLIIVMVTCCVFFAVRTENVKVE
jgi:hypothetical protein